MSRKGVFKMLSFGVNDNVIGDVIVGVGKLGNISSTTANLFETLKCDNDLVYVTTYDKIWGYKDILKSYPYEIKDNYLVYTINDRQVYIEMDRMTVFFFGRRVDLERDNKFYQALRLKLNDKSEQDLSDL